MSGFKEGGIYRGVVISIKPYGAFIALEDGNDVDSEKRHNNRLHRQRTTGLCHISQIVSNRRLEDPSEVLAINDDVWVEVTEIRSDGKLSLSMQNVDQSTGKEIRDVNRHSGYSKKRKTTMDAWEMNQLRQAYGVKRSKLELRGEDEDPFAEVEEESSDGGLEGDEEDVEIELNGELPPFLAGSADKLKVKGGQNEPEKAVRMSDNSLQRIAENGSRFLTEMRREKAQRRREQQKKKREQERKAADQILAGSGENSEDEMQESKEKESEIRAVREWRNESRHESYGIRSHKSMREQRESLPIFEVRSDLMKLVADNDMLVVVGETGSGKSTQLTQYVAEEGYGERGMIACTQPRRVAAKSVAKRVAEEVGCKLGEEVGYKIRFEDCSSSSTAIKYITDGMLEREALIDPDMSQYSVIMLDEAHERTVATDVLFALLREAVRRRKGGLKLIITSATLDSVKFSRYFDECPVFHIKGRTFPVKIFYSKQPETDYIEATIETVVDIHVNNAPGDILVFLTGREEIEACCETIVQKMTALYKADSSIPELIVLPIYSAMPSEMQSRIFEATPRGKRKVVVATNIAETSITIDGVYYVIDPGFVKVNAYDAKLGMDSLIVQPISRAQASQRAGRAGRTGPGICYRLYTKRAYEREMASATVPEIQRQNLSNTVLMLKAMGIDDVVHFAFMDRPKEESLLAALQELYILDALAPDGRITPTGRRMSFFPMEPLLSKTLMQSVHFGCSYEVVVIIAMLTVPDVFYRPRDRRDQADKAKRQFDDFTGDHLTLLNVYEKWEDSHFSRSWCEDHYIHLKSMQKARDVRKQLIQIIDQIDRSERNSHSSIVSCRGNRELILKAFVSGYFKNCAKRVSNAGHYDEEGTYRTLVEDTPVHVHPSSALYRKSGAEYVLYHTLILTNKEYMHCITKINPSWLVQYAPKFYKQANANELSLTKRREKIKPLWNRFDPNERWRLSKGRR